MGIFNKRDDEDGESNRDPVTEKRLLALHELCFLLYQAKEKTQAELTRMLSISKHDVAKYCTTPPTTQ